MAAILFHGIDQRERQSVTALFDYLARAKRADEIDEKVVARILGERYHDKFWWPSEQEQDAWVQKYIAADEWARENDPALKRPWDFASWVSALDHLDVELMELNIDERGNGKLEYQPLKNFSGKIDALEQVVKVFDGKLL